MMIMKMRECEDAMLQRNQSANGGLIERTLTFGNIQKVVRGGWSAQKVGAQREAQAE